MVQLQVKLGLKGQVLIPKILRDEFGLVPGREVVIMETSEGVLITRPHIENPIAVFEKCAKQYGKKDFKYDKKGYYKQIEGRWNRAKR